MRDNDSTAVLSEKFTLVPYYKHHVPTYHEWMKDPYLLEATASKPLTLDEEYKMQERWHTDKEKLTFIVCQPVADFFTASEVKAGEVDTPDKMIGDVNLYLYRDEDEYEPVFAGGERWIGEIEIMIARKDLWGQGLGRAVLTGFFWYIFMNLGSWMSGLGQGPPDEYPRRLPTLNKFIVKIAEKNARSMQLFKNMGFVTVGEKPNHFGEMEMVWPWTHENMSKYLSQSVQREHKCVKYIKMTT